MSWWVWNQESLSGHVMYKEAGGANQAYDHADNIQAAIASPVATAQ